MDRNTLLFIVLSVTVLLGWNLLQANRPPDPRQKVTANEAAVEVADSRSPASPPPASLNELPPRGESSSDPEPSPERVVASEPEEPAWSRVFETDLYRATLTNKGAALTSWELSEERYSERTPEGIRPIEILSGSESERLVLRTPFEEFGFGDLGSRRYRVESSTADSAVLVLEAGGVTIRKTYRFDPGNYLLRLSVSVDNRSGRILNPRFETQWPAEVSEAPDFQEQSLIAFHDDGVEREAVAGVGVPGIFSDLFGSADPDGVIRLRGGVDWAGVDLRYFVGAVLPDRATSANARFQATVPGQVAMTVLGFDPIPLPSGQAVVNDYRVYLGPKETKRLEAVGAQLVQSIDFGYGWIAPLTRFFNWLLNVIYAFVGNYGVAIILLTILVRVATLPIVGRQMKSMEKMRAVQPQIQELQAKYKDDRQKQSEEMMKFYKENGVNPLGGCLPMLLQFPVFIGLFFALQSSIQLRHAPFFGYIDDLSAPATLFVIPEIDLPVRLLPILMGLSMIVQQRMTPMTMDPAQAKMMMTIMPVMMTVLFYQFPSGLVLYWMISNVLGIAHQAWVGKQQRAAA